MIIEGTTMKKKRIVTTQRKRKRDFLKFKYLVRSKFYFAYLHLSTKVNF